MKIIGVIGGLGPETSATFYLELITRSFIKNKVQRPAILLWNVPIPYAVEEELIVNGSGEEKYLPFLLDGAKRLEKGGANFIVIPCNSVHIFIEEIRNSVKIPVLSIVEETTKKIVKKKLKKIGFLSTELTVKKKIYQDIFIKNDIECVCPELSSQHELNEIIQKILKNEITKKEINKMKMIIDTLREKNLKDIVLACTDLQHIVSSTNEYKVLDTMSILAEATIDFVLEDIEFNV